MATTPFQFELYRVAVVETDRGLFDNHLKAFAGDKEISEVIRHAAAEVFDRTVATERSEHVWALRSYTPYGGTKATPDVIVVRLGRGIKSQVTSTLASGDFHEERSEFNPPTAEYVHLVFYMKRHFVAVEYRAAITGASGWRRALEDILASSAESLEFSSRIELEAVPGKDRVLSLFRSFDTLTHFKVVLRLPNPEFSNEARALYEAMERGAIREFAQRMYNPRGLSQQVGRFPHSAAELAEAGYKHGDVQMEGIIDGQRKKKRAGKKAARSSIETSRDMARGMLINARTEEARKCLAALIEEMDRTSPAPNGGIGDAKRKGGRGKKRS